MEWMMTLPLPPPLPPGQQTEQAGIDVTLARAKTQNRTTQVGVASPWHFSGRKGVGRSRGAMIGAIYLLTVLGAKLRGNWPHSTLGYTSIFRPRLIWFDTFFKSCVFFFFMSEKREARPKDKNGRGKRLISQKHSKTKSDRDIHQGKQKAVRARAQKRAGGRHRRDRRGRSPGEKEKAGTVQEGTRNEGR